MTVQWLLLAAYACSGAAGLIYEVSWTRLLTLSMGHSTAAASTVVAAFMGGLAIGSALGGRVADRLSPRRALFTYALLEISVATIALAVGPALSLFNPLLARAYGDGHETVLFGLVRLVVSLLLLSVPAAALGATFPMAVRGRGDLSPYAGEQGGALYAANTGGAAAGALFAGFVLLPATGLFRTTLTGACASLAAAGIVALLARTAPETLPQFGAARRHSGPLKPAKSRAAPRTVHGPRTDRRVEAPRLAAVLLGLTGFATFVYEIAWTRVFSMIVGPSTYAFSTTVTAIVAGTAIGSAVGTLLARRMKQPVVAIAIALGSAALALSWTTMLIGGEVPRYVMQQLVELRLPFRVLMLRHALLVGALILPVAIAIGAAFPLVLELVGVEQTNVAKRVGLMYAVNTVGSVAGSLAAGFAAIPMLGLEHTLWLAIVALAAGALIVSATRSATMFARAIGVGFAVAAVGIAVFGTGWDRPLLASGAYKYARHVPPDVDPETVLTAGSLLYYRDGAVSTVSVKRITGELSLAVDGKVDASTSSGDMLTQKMLGHLPLLLHPNARMAAVIGLGSGITPAAMLRHPIASVDVVEISPEVVQASRYFADRNRDVLNDPRMHLIVGDGRSHMLLTGRRYDVIVSEPSNPWIAGIAALFTREFFTGMRNALAPGGIVCQWAHTYDIRDRDLRSVVGTFASVFPHVGMWLLGDGDLLLIGAAEPIESRLEHLAEQWRRPGVAEDLVDVGVRDPFEIWSMFVGGTQAARGYASGAAIQTDDRMALEFSGPAGLYEGDTAANVAAVRRLSTGGGMPQFITDALAHAPAEEWRHRALLMMKVSAYDQAVDNYKRALALDRGDADALAGLVPAAVAAHRETEIAGLLKSLAADRPGDPRVRMSLSRLLAASGDLEDATRAAAEACRVAPSDIAAWSQLASIYSDSGNADRLGDVVQTMRRIDPKNASTLYYSAAEEFMQGHPEPARRDAEAAIAADPLRADAHNLVGIINASAGQAEAARTAFNTARALNPRDSSTYTNLAVLELNHNPEAARRWFAEALSLDPQSRAAREGLARASVAAQNRF